MWKIRIKNLLFFSSDWNFRFGSCLLGPEWLRWAKVYWKWKPTRKGQTLITYGLRQSQWRNKLSTKTPTAFFVLHWRKDTCCSWSTWCFTDRYGSLGYFNSDIRRLLTSQELRPGNLGYSPKLFIRVKISKNIRFLWYKYFFVWKHFLVDFRHKIWSLVSTEDFVTI